MTMQNGSTGSAGMTHAFAEALNGCASGGALLPVPFGPGRRLAAARAARPDRTWSEPERDILRDHYEREGPAWCAAALPERCIEDVYREAGRLGLRAPRHRGRRARRESSAALDAAIKAAWPGVVGRGALAALAARLNVPRQWLGRRAAALDLDGATRWRKEPRWTAAELALLRRVPLHDLARASAIFRDHGFVRSGTAIGVRAQRLALGARDTAPLSARAVSQVTGLDEKTVARMIETGEIQGTRRATARLDSQGGDPWSVERGVARAWIIDNLDRVDLRRVDKVRFVALLIAPDAGDAPVPAPRPVAERGRREAELQGRIAALRAELAAIDAEIAEIDRVIGPAAQEPVP